MTQIGEFIVISLAQRLPYVLDRAVAERIIKSHRFGAGRAVYFNTRALHARSCAETDFKRDADIPTPLLDD